MGFGAFIRLELTQVIQTIYDATGFLRAQHEGLGEKPNVGSNEVLHPLGFAARARDPDTGPDGKALSGGGCKMLLFRDGTDLFSEFKGDQRAIARIPPLTKGGSVQYADTGKSGPISIDVHSGDDGTKQIYIEIDQSAHVLTIGRDGNAEPVIEFTHADGMALSFFKKKAILKNAAGDCFIELNDSGGTLNGNFKVVGDITDASGVSLFKHQHPTAMGPSGPPLPSLI
jgi:hypothetical protein